MSYMIRAYTGVKSYSVRVSECFLACLYTPGFHHGIIESQHLAEPSKRREDIAGNECFEKLANETGSR